MKKRLTTILLLLLMTSVLSSCMIFSSRDARDRYFEALSTSELEETTSDTEATDAAKETTIDTEATRAAKETTSDTEATRADKETDTPGLEAEEIAEFTDESMLPMQFAISEDDKYVYLLQDIDRTYSKISVSDSATELNVVYDAGEFYIKNMACGNGFTAWTESTDDAYAVKCYNHKTDEVTVIHSGHYDFDTDYQILEIKAYKDCVYYTLYFNDKDYAAIMCYDVTLGSETEYMTAEFYLPEKLISAQYESLDLNDGWLICSEKTTAGTIDVWMINLEDDSNMLCHLKQNVLLVYGASFDQESNTLALYYQTVDDSDHIVICSESGAVTDVVDFNRSSVAYRDRIRYIDGNLYYVEQTVKHGSANNFRFRIVSKKGEDILDYKYAFSYFVADDGSIYMLTNDFSKASASVKLLHIVP